MQRDSLPSLVKRLTFRYYAAVLFSYFVTSSNSLSTIINGERTVVILYNKPRHVVCSHSRQDEKGRINIYDDIITMKGYVGENHSDADDFESVTRMKTKIHAVGRLDAETTGLLLLTNDGGLVHHVTSSHCITAHNKRMQQQLRNDKSTVITKTYKVLIMGHHTDTPALGVVSVNKGDHESNKANIFHILRTQGVNIGEKYGGWTQPVVNVVVEGHPTNKSTSLFLTLSEGKNRQIRRMFHALGSGVMKLERIRIGDHLTLDGIEKEGDWRILSDEEVVDRLHWEPRLLEKREPRPRTTRIVDSQISNIKRRTRRAGRK